MHFGGTPPGLSVHHIIGDARFYSSPPGHASGSIQTYRSRVRQIDFPVLCERLLMKRTKIESAQVRNNIKLDRELRAHKLRIARRVVFVALLVVGVGTLNFVYRMPAEKETVLTAVVTGHTSLHSELGNLPFLMVALPSGDRVRVRRHRQPNHQIGDFVTVIESKRLLGTPRYRLVDSLR